PPGPQRADPAGSPPPAPPVDVLPPPRDLLPERPDMLPRGDLAHQRATLLGGQAHVDDVLDQLVTKQRHPAGPLGPTAGLLISSSQCGASSTQSVIYPRRGFPPIRPLPRGDSCWSTPSAARAPATRHGSARPRPATPTTRAATHPTGGRPPPRRPAPRRPRPPTATKRPRPARRPGRPEPPTMSTP